ncbi:MAG: DUF4340 domain-containing protein [Rickettsiales bacterium]
MNKRLLILLGLMAALIAAVLFSYGQDETPNTEKPEQSLLFPDLQNEVNKVTRIELAQGKVHTTVARDKNGIWRIKQKSDYPANRNMVRNLISAFSRTYLMEARTAKKENYKALGLDDSFVRRIDLYTDSEKPVASLYVGLQKAARGATFVHRPDEDQTWLAKENLAFEVSPEDWLQKELLSIPDIEIKSMTVTHSDSPEVKIWRDKPGSDLKLAAIPKGKTLKDPVLLSSQLNVFNPLTIDDVRPSSELRASSLDAARIITFDGRDITFRLNKQDTSTWVTVEASYHPEMTPAGDKASAAQAFVDKLSQATEGFAYKMQPYAQDKLAIKINDLIK